MSTIISVVLCTYNSSDMLRGCLDSLCVQTLDQNKYEIIVVDNNSSDETKQITETFQDKGNIHYCVESKLGLSYARNHGLKEARGDYIAYIDDDALATHDWLRVAYSLIESLRPAPDCLGGPIFPFYTSSKPVWFKDKYEIRKDWKVSKFLEHGESFSGSNMIWNKSSLNLINGFDVQLGVKGNALILGEETLSFDKIWGVRENPRLYYSPALIVKHWVPESKMRVSYRVKRNMAQGQYFAAINQSMTVFHKTKHFFRLIFDCAKISVRAIICIGSYSRWQNWVIEQWSYFFISMGELLGILGIRLTFSQKTD